MTPTVLDTNIVLDLWVFEDPRVQGLREALSQAQLDWLASAPMREELSRVLAYPHIAARLQQRGLPAAELLARFDRHSRCLPDAPRAPYVCKDPDDQKFIDLAVQHRAQLHSKDKQVLRMKNRLARCGVALNPPHPTPQPEAPAP